MARDFFFQPATCDIKTLDFIKEQWTNVPTDAVRKHVAEENQYLYFLHHQLQACYTTPEGQLKEQPYKTKLGLSVRAGVIKSFMLIVASISEAVLRDHAEIRGYRLAPEQHKRGFGNILHAWTFKKKKKPRAPRAEIEKIWDALKELQDIRNNIHIFKAAEDPSSHFFNILDNEKRLIEQAGEVLNHLMTLKSEQTRETESK